MDQQIVTALNDPDSAAAQRADARLDEKEGIRATLSMVNPLYQKFRLKSVVANKPLVVAANAAFDEGRQPTGAESFAQFLDDLDDTSDARGRELLLDKEVYDAIINDPVARPVYDAWDGIRNGTPTNSVAVRGEDDQLHTYTPAQIAAMRDNPEQGRGYTRALADLWAEQNGYLGLVRDYEYNKDRFMEANPDLDASYDMKWRIAPEYDATHGKGAWIADTRKVNPAYDAYMGELDQALAGGEIDQGTYDGAALSWKAYAAIQGWKPGPYDQPVEAGGQVAGGTTIAAAAKARDTKFPREQAAAITADLALYKPVADAARAAGYDPAVFENRYDPAVPGSGYPKELYFVLSDMARLDLGYGPYVRGQGPLEPWQKDTIKDWINERIYLSTLAEGYQESGYQDPMRWLISPQYQWWQHEATPWFDPMRYPPAT